jgi:hypothetical protein
MLALVAGGGDGFRIARPLAGVIPSRKLPISVPAPVTRFDNVQLDRAADGQQGKPGTGWHTGICDQCVDARRYVEAIDG